MTEHTAQTRMPMTAALRAVWDARSDDDVVVTTMGTAREWMTFGSHPRDFVLVPSSMGQATTLGLGIALAQPDRRVIICNGDGSMLMNLGSLVTITSQSPPNLSLLLFDNQIYEITGAQPTPANPAIRNGSGRIDFPAMARASGFDSVTAFDDLETWSKEIKGILDTSGPNFVHLTVAPVPGAVGPKSPSPAPERARAFRGALCAR